MTISGAVTRTDGSYEHDGRLWRPKPDAQSTFDESVAARKLFIELHTESNWNPWVLDDRAADLGRAEQVMQEWERAEPGFRPKTKRQLDAQMARWDRDFKKRHAAENERRERGRERYDPEREHTRLSLLEQESILAHKFTEVEKLRSGEAFPLMDPKRRADQVAELDALIPRLEEGVEELSTAVGNREEVVDERGWLPADRRASMLFDYRFRRTREVETLRAKAPELAAQLKVTKGRVERAPLRDELREAERQLAKWLAVPPLTADDMCSECPTPASMHGWVSPPAIGPCPAWPGWAARIAEARRMLESWSERAKPIEPPKSKPEPLAVIPSRTPIAEVVQRLQELQEQFPDAEVRRGRANRWELWPEEDVDA